MFDLAALSLPNAATAPQATPLQNGGNALESNDGAAPVPGLAFDALLALQIAPAEPADAPLPESGKILPDAAKLLAVVPQGRLTDVQVRPQAAKPRTDTEAEPNDGEFNSAPELPDAILPDTSLPDAGLVAALFASPDRVAVAEGETNRAPADGSRTAASQATPATDAPRAPAQAAIALARTAQIELITAPEATPVPVQPQAVAPTPTAQLMAARQVRQNKPADAVAEASEAIARPSPLAGAKPLEDGEHAETLRVEATSTTSLLADRSLATPETAAPGPSASRISHEARTERIDFATLVENVARAREEASPRAVTASINHAEFGRVTLRFDREEDRGMSVTMASADPGFARAVNATAEASRTPTESTGQNPQSQADARTQSGPGEGQRQHPRQAEQTPTRPFSGSSASARDEGASSPRSDDRGIYA